MKTPAFWQNKDLVSTLLMPIGFIYGFATKLRVKKKPEYKAPVPVICIGNITAGGVGKTPVAIAISKMLSKPFFISRGYGGSLKSALVDIKRHNASEVGDEPLLLAQHAPTLINANRAQSAKKAVDMGAEVLIMDDGFQNPKLYKDLSFVVIDGNFGFGNFRYVPAGPMREKQIRADAVIILGNDKHNLAQNIKQPIFYGTITPIKPQIKNKDIIAFAGIGRPQKFYDSLKECGFNLIQTTDFADHHQYTKAQLQQLITEANGLEIWTTAKDFIKIPPELQKYFKTLEIEIKWQNKSKLQKFILTSLHK